MAKTESTLMNYDDKLRGLIVPDVSTLRDDVRKEAKEAFGDELSVDDETPQGRLIESFALLRTAVLGLNADTANQININLATGRTLDAIGSFFKVYRNAATRNRIYVNLSADPYTTIPSGSIIATSKGIKYYIAQDQTFGRDEQYRVDVVAVAVDAGEVDAYFDKTDEANYDPIDTIVTGVIGWKGVSNNADGKVLYYGEEEESDERFRNRLLKARFFGTGYLNSIAARFAQTEGLEGTFCYENCDANTKYISQSGKMIDMSAGTFSENNGIVIPGHHVLVVADCSEELYGDVAKILFETKAVGAGMVNVAYLQHKYWNAEKGIADTTKFSVTQNNHGKYTFDEYKWVFDSSKTYTSIRLYYVDEFYGKTYPITFSKPIDVKVSMVIDVDGSNFTGTDIASTIKNAVMEWAKGNVEGVDGVKIGEPVYAHEVSSGISSLVPSVKVMNVNLFSGPYAGASADDATGRITMNNVDGSFKIDMFCVEKAEILTQNMRVRVFGSDRQLDASKGDSL